MKTRSPRYFILVGNEDAWTTSLSLNIWGFSERVKSNWNLLEIGDYVAFYVTLPVKKIIEFGSINRKYTNDDIIWPDEKVFGRAIWRYKIGFEIHRLMNDWHKGVSVPKNIMLNTGRKSVVRATFMRIITQLIEKKRIEDTIP